MLDPNDMTNFPTIGKLQMDMMLLALTCGMTNVATFMWANADSWQYYPFAGANEEHHGTSHCDDSDSANVNNLVNTITGAALTTTPGGNGTPNTAIGSWTYTAVATNP